ncbi:S-layer homology domain-containing protein [Paenibacillus brevis]|uniref:S-layer homology domain-containing protein n=1 Tax=Paenibacillus brevis TaxID=2841508 RepID=A0ABS6FP95_9BACL|nr:S-layer homology domain-containing protein [Paenibacillus brevis]MBU5672042.1 S-layer homology domain-containing protein [Paenibacillus brevis]
MKRGLKIVVSWLCLFSLFVGPLSVFGAGTGEISWPNPGATQLTKTAEPTGNSGEWKVTLKVEGKNIKSSSDVVLVIDKSGSMDNGTWWTDGKIEKAKEAAKKFVDNLLLSGSDNQVAVVAFNNQASLVSGFKGPAQKTALKNAIDGISATSGTNIQAGIKNARDLLGSSSAQNKIIVVLSDGEPTYSFKGTQATSYSWSNNSYGYALTAFNYNQTLGNGSNFSISNYNVNGYSVKDNGIGTISEAKLAKDAGYKIYSVGLDVSSNSNAIKVLKDVQSEGYYPANSQELNTIFQQMASQITYAAQNAKVIDPMGDMFNLKKQGAVVSPTDYTASQGTVTWNAATETFTWDIGNIAEGTPATLTYTVVMDQSKNPVSNELYPTNGTTTLTYTDVNNKNVSKDFEVPKVSVGNGSILIKGYLVNEAGNPINAEGVEVEGPAFAEPLYSEYYKDQSGKEAFPVGTTHSIAAKTVEGYLYQVGGSPKSVTLTVTNPTPTVWFGYTVATETSVQVKYLEQGTEKELRAATTVPGVVGQTLKLTAEVIDGYTVAGTGEENYTFTGSANQEFVFYYTANEQSVTVKYVDRASGNEIAAATSESGVTGGKVTLEAKVVEGYTAEVASYEYTFLPEGNTYTFYYNAGEQSVEVQYLEQGTEKELHPATTVAGTTGQTLELTAKIIPGYTPVEPSYSYKLGTTNAPHVFYYTANEQSVTVKYVDRASGNEIAAATSESGVTGGKVTLEAKFVEGYTAEVASYEYTFLPEGNTYTFYYNAGEQSVEVQYLEQGTEKELHPATTVAGTTGQTLELTAKIIPGYTPVEPSYSYKLGTTNAPHVFYYTANPIVTVTVAVYHLDLETGEEIAAPSVLEGIGGGTLEFTPQPISATDGTYTYYPQEPIYNFELTFEPDQRFDVYYVKGDPVSAVTLTVIYLDETTGVELGRTELIRSAGTSVALTAKEFEGYTPKIENAVITLTDEPSQTYTFYYTKKDVVPVEKPVTIKYLLNGTNQQLANAKTEYGTPGETKTYSAIGISGYTPVQSTKNYTFSDEDGQELIFYYTRNSSSGPSNPSPSPSSSVTPLPALPPLPAVPPVLDRENHYDYINGYPDGSVKPLNNITREEVAAIFYRLMNDESRSAYLKTTNSFSDVGATRWSNKHISTMENAGIITGYLDGTFKPGQYITRSEFAAIASRFDQLDERVNDMFSDITGHWAEKYIVSAANKGWIKGYVDGTFKPDQYITRAEAASFINSVLNRKVNHEGIHEDAKEWPDNIVGKWYYYDILEATNHHEYIREEDSDAEVWEEVLPNRVYP